MPNRALKLRSALCLGLASGALLCAGCGNGAAGPASPGDTGAAGRAGGMGGVGSGGLSGSAASSAASAGSSGTSASGGGGSAGVSAGAAGGGNTIPATFDTVRLVVQGGGGIQSCGAAPCHGVGGNAPPGNPVTLADDAQLHQHLLAYTSHACGNLPLVSPGNPGQSALLAILRGPCGSTPRMPDFCVPADADGTCIPDEYIAALAQWIANGAPN